MGESVGARLDPLVETRAVSKRYGTTLALDSVSMRIFPGQSVALVGRNGAGKSTIVRLLTGLDRPDAGEVLFAGQPAPDISARATWRANVACVYQKSTIIPELTVGENVFLNDYPRTRWGKIRWGEVRRQTHRELNAWGLEVDPDQRAGDLGVGQRQLLEIVRALRQGSRLIVLDEPTAQLESREIKQLFGHVARMNADGVTFLFISHHLEEIYEICQRVNVMRDGRLVAEAAVRDITKADLVAAMVGEAYARTDQPAARPAGSQAGKGGDASLDARPIVLEVDALDVPDAVRGVSLRVRAGERVGLAGLGGSGKSELAQAIVGQLVPRSGSVAVEGRAVPAGRVDFARDRGIAFVPEDRHANGFCSNLSVEENISLPVLRRLSTWGVISGQQRRATAEAMISALQMKVSSPRQNTAELSGGNQQKTVMGRALVTGPKVLVLDHPTAGVDIASKQALFDSIRAAKSAVLIVSDEIEELEICDRVLVLFEGKIVREFGCDWQEHDMVAAMEGLRQ